MRLLGLELYICNERVMLASKWPLRGYLLIVHNLLFMVKREIILSLNGLNVTCYGYYTPKVEVYLTN